jgi:hypothetical protein
VVAVSLKKKGQTEEHTDRQTNRHDETNGRFSQFSERA